MMVRGGAMQTEALGLTGATMKMTGMGSGVIRSEHAVQVCQHALLCDLTVLAGTG